MAKQQKRKVTAQPAAVANNLPVVNRTNSNEFNPDYSYVVEDLKKIGLLAVIFISILVGLSFVI